MYRCSLLVIFVLACAPAWGATYYVDATRGSDGNAGTAAESAWKTVAKVNASTFSAGDSILFKRGETWWETLTPPSSGAAENPIIFGAYGSGANPVFDGSVEILGSPNDWSCAANYCTKNIGAVKPNVIWINGLKQHEGSGKGNTLGDWTYNRPNIRLYAGPGKKPADVYISVFSGSKDAGIYIKDRDYIRITNITIRRFQDNGSPAYTTTSGGIILCNAHCGQVDGCSLADNGNGILVYNASGASIFNNTITGTYNKRSVPSGWGVLIESDNVIVYGNVINQRGIFYNGTTAYVGHGIVCAIRNVSAGMGCANVKIHNNTVSYPYYYGINVSDLDSNSGDAPYLGIEIYENILTNGNPIGGDTDGISAGGQSVAGNAKGGMKVYRNRIDGYLNSGIQITNLWHNVEVYYNVISNCGGSASDYGWGGIKVRAGIPVYNNTIFNSYQDGISLAGDGTTYNVYNNIIHTVNHTQAGHGRCIFVDKTGTANSRTNICYKSSNGLSGGAGTFNGAGNLTSDPCFVSTSTPDFHLLRNSPAIKAGTNVSLTTDHAGHPVPKAPDIGAYEYQGASSTPQAPQGLRF